MKIKSAIYVLLLAVMLLSLLFNCKKDHSDNSTKEPTPFVGKPTGAIPATLSEMQNIPAVTSIDTTLFPILKSSVSLPTTASIDVPSPGNQNFNSCMAWAAGYGMLSYLFKNIEGHTDYIGSDKLFSPYFIWNQLNGGENKGISFPSALNLLKEQGCCKITDMPLNVALTTQPTLTAKNNAANYKITSYRSESFDINVLKSFLANHYPILILVKIDRAFQNGELENQNDGRSVWKNYKDQNFTNHGLLVCGYDDGINAFKILNSWGSYWGNNGYCWLDYDFFKIAVVQVNGRLYPEIYLSLVQRPLLSTNTVSEVTSNSAKCGGTITSDRNYPVIDRGVCWSTSSDPTIANDKTSDGTGKGSFLSSLSGLTANTKYYVKAYAINSCGISYGTQQSFTTSAIQLSSPVLSTSAVSSITQISAISGGNITSDGGAQVIARGVCWSTSQTPTTANNKTSDGTGVGSFTSNITGLTANTNYFVRAYATNSAGTSYGDQVQFTTGQATTLPTVTTSTASNITQTSATIGGNVTADGNATVTSRGVCWSTSHNPTISDNKTTDGTGTGVFTSNITGLTANTTYYVRAYATNNVNTGYGSEVLFKTSIGDNSIVFNPNLTYGTLMDVDGNTYKTIQIGTQTWMAENLRVTHFRNGDPITYVTDDSAWSVLNANAYCYYNNDVNNAKIYGCLYNRNFNNLQNIAPIGWHIPTDAEWKTLRDYLGGTMVAGGKLKEAGTSHWLSPNTGSTNESGFTALPGGKRSSSGFSLIGTDGIWWNAFRECNGNCDNDETQMEYNNSKLYSSWVIVFDTRIGWSIRCVKD